MKPASVIIMDEHPIVRMSIEVLLQKNKNIQVKLKSGDSHEVLDCIRNHPIDLVILDIEVTVLRYLANGLSNKEIADQLLLSNKTISAHKSNIFSKLGVQSIVELIDYAKAHELL